MLWRIADLIERDLEELAELESIDNGKPYAVARVADLPLAVDMFRYMGGWATKITGSTLPLSLPGEYLSYTVREPVGVVGQIIPWNFPAADGGVEDRAGAGGGLHHRAEGGRADAADRAAAGGADRRSRRARRRGQHPDRLRRDRRRGAWRRIPMSTRSRSPDRPRSAS